MKTPLAIALALALCGGPVAPAMLAAQAANSALSCPVPAGWASVARLQPKFVVFGELHGTEQSPRFVGQLACSQALRGKRVVLALEHGANFDDALQAAWKLPSGQFEQALAKLGWAGRQDGVASKAMFDLFVQMHLLKERGLPISVTAFSGARDKQQHDRFRSLPGQGPHEAAQAENIAAAATAHSPDLVIVLVGNLHARKAPVERRGTSWEPMALQLSSHGKVVSLDMRYATGTSWNCLMKPDARPAPGQPIGPEQMTCGPNPAPGNANRAGPPRIELSAKTADAGPNGFDGTFWVGPVSASPPAMR